jgi:hypothetical protein
LLTAIWGLPPRQREVIALRHELTPTTTLEAGQ